MIGDAYGALSLGAVWDGAQGVRVHQDAFVGERALASNAERLGLDDRVTSVATQGEAAPRRTGAALLPVAALPRRAP